MKPNTFARRAMMCALTFSVSGLGGCSARAEEAGAESKQAGPTQAKVAEAGGAAPVARAGAVVTLLKTPHEGIQPQAALDAEGTLHLIYFKGRPEAGDIFYVSSRDGGKSFSAPLRVNSQAGSAIATGTIRGAQLALGKGNRVHVAWNGSGLAEPKGVGGAPMLYARLNSDRTAFEAQRNLITWAGGLDGGGTLAADAEGRVFVAWHAAAGAEEDAGRAVYLARSTDEGKSFERERKVSPSPTGACGCCQMRALVDASGVLHILYRAAGNNVDRDSLLLVSRDHGDTFLSSMLQPWSIMMCPMSSYSLAQSRAGVLAAWETESQVFFAPLPRSENTGNTGVPKSGAVKLQAAPGASKARKHPVVLEGADGQVLLAWTEGTGWNQGGSLAWQLYDAQGQASGDKGRSQGVAAWSLLSAVALPQGGFLLLH